MNNSKIIGAFIAIVALFIGAAFWIDRRERTKKIIVLKRRNGDLEEENQSLRMAYINLNGKLNEIRRLIEADDEVDLNLRNKLFSLFDQYQSIDPNIAQELISTINLIESKEHSKAAFSLAKIVENLLEGKYKGDSGFAQFLQKQNRSARRAAFNDYLDYAKDSGAIEKEEHHFAKGLKELRNQEGHKVNVKKESNWIHTALYTGLGLILRLTIPPQSTT